MAIEYGTQVTYRKPTQQKGITRKSFWGGDHCDRAVAFAVSMGPQFVDKKDAKGTVRRTMVKTNSTSVLSLQPVQRLKGQKEAS